MSNQPTKGGRGGNGRGGRGSGSGASSPARGRGGRGGRGTPIKKNDEETLTQVEQQQNKENIQNPKNDRNNKETKKEREEREKRQAEAREQAEYRRVGLVRGVVSGDTLVLMDVADLKKNSNNPTEPPKETQLTLLGLKAPTLGRRNAEDPKKKEDKPYAWESREFLRSKAIGKCVVYRVEHEVGGRQYGEVWLGDENLRFSIVEKGWADVITRNKPKRGEDAEEDDQSRLEELKEEAKSAKRGMWGGRDQTHIRKINYREVPKGGRGDDVYQFFERNQNKQLKGVVEQVHSGSILRVLLTNTMDEIQLQLAGVRCPQYNQFNDAQSEPFSREAKFFMEHVLLHRDVIVTLDYIDKYNTLFGTVTDAHGANVTLNLLQMGLASFVEWSASKNANIAQYKEAEKKAQDAKLRIWSLKQPLKPVQEETDSGRQKQRKQEAGKETFIGQVVEIVNAGTLTVRVNKGDKERERWVDRKISFSSIKALRMPPPPGRKDDDKKDDKKQDQDDKTKEEEEKLKALEEAWAIEAKEYLRSTLIGKQVKCVFDYVRPSFNENGPKLFWSVYNGDENVAVQLVNRGFATVVSHGRDEPRSSDFQALTMAEKAAKKAGKGIHGPLSKKPVYHNKDLTNLPKDYDMNKVKQFLPFLKRAGRVQAIVETVYSSTKYKLFIPSESLYVNYSLIGCATERPLRVEKGKNNKETTFFSNYPPNTAGNRALHYARDNLYQRSVDISVESCDKGGNFIGTLFLNKKDFGLQLLHEGHAKLLRYSIQDLRILQKDYDAAAEYAEKNKLGFYGSREGDIKEPEREDKKPRKERQQTETEDVEEEVEEENDQDDKPKGPKVSEPFSLAITEIIDGSHFYYQKIGDKTKALDDMMNVFQKEDWASAQPIAPTEKNILVAAKFTADDLWYRAKVIRLVYSKEKDEEKKSDEKPKPVSWEIEYIDYGNKETVTSDRLRPLPKQYSIEILDRQAHEGKLVYVKAPRIDSEFGRDAAAHFKKLVWGKDLRATQHMVGGTISQLSLGDPKSKISINADMVINGWAKVDERRRRGKGAQRTPEFLKKLQEEEARAKASRINMWQYGDAPDSDDEREQQRR